MWCILPEHPLTTLKVSITNWKISLEYLRKRQSWLSSLIRVAKLDPKVGSRRTTKIKNLVVLVIILAVLILLPNYMYVVLVLILLFLLVRER